MSLNIFLHWIDCCYWLLYAGQQINIIRQYHFKNTCNIDFIPNLFNSFKKMKRNVMMIWRMKMMKEQTPRKGNEAKFVDKIIGWTELELELEWEMVKWVSDQCRGIRGKFNSISTTPLDTEFLLENKKTCLMKINIWIFTSSKSHSFIHCNSQMQRKTKGIKIISHSSHMKPLADPQWRLKGTKQGAHCVCLDFNFQCFCFQLLSHLGYAIKM